LDNHTHPGCEHRKCNCVCVRSFHALTDSLPRMDTDLARRSALSDRCLGYRPTPTREAAHCWRDIKGPASVGRNQNSSFFCSSVPPSNPSSHSLSNQHEVRHCRCFFGHGLHCCCSYSDGSSSFCFHTASSRLIRSTDRSPTPARSPSGTPSVVIHSFNRLNSVF
jgi:hypothetical protein